MLLPKKNKKSQVPVAREVKSPDNRAVLNSCLADLNLKIDELVVTVNQYKEEYQEVQKELFFLDVPYRDGDTALVEIHQGKKMEVKECLLSLVYDAGLREFKFHAYPRKNDGQFSGRYFIVYDLSHIKEVVK